MHRARHFISTRGCFVVLIVLVCECASQELLADSSVPIIRSAHSGSWSDGGTWEGGKTPGSGARVLVRAGHRVVYDVASDTPIRGINVAGTLTFAPDRDTRLCVGLLKIQDADEYSEEGFDCETHLQPPDPNRERAALEVGTADKPIDAAHTATIRLTYFDGLDRQSCPAIVCCGGRMDIHGAPLDHTWTKLGCDAKPGDAEIALAESVSGWRAGDRIIVTATTVDENEMGTRRPGKHNRRVFTEERTVQIAPRHEADARSAAGIRSRGQRRVPRRGGQSQPQCGRRIGRPRRDSRPHDVPPPFGRQHQLRRIPPSRQGRRLGPLCPALSSGGRHDARQLGRRRLAVGQRQPLAHDSRHEFLVVRDCVGYQSVGHGFFLEDGTETYNVLDHNLAVQAYEAKPLPKQALPFDQNEGAGFWWANSLNTFTRNVACENDRYGFRFQAEKSSGFDPTLAVLQPDGTRRPTDIRTLPFVRFDDNEAHCDGLYGFNLGEGVNRVGPDVRHPFVIRRMKLWQIHYAFRPESPSVLVDNMQIDRSIYGVYHPNYDHHVYRNLTINGDGSEPFNRGHDDDSIQYGPLAVDGLTFTETRGYQYSIPLIQISDDNPTGHAESHFRDVQVSRQDRANRRPVVDTGGGAHVTPTTVHGVPVYLHDYYGPDRTAKIEATNAKDFAADGQKYRDDSPLTGHEARVSEVHGGVVPAVARPGI